MATYVFFPVLTISPRINLRDVMCGRRAGAIKTPPKPAMYRPICTKVKP